MFDDIQNKLHNDDINDQENRNIIIKRDWGGSASIFAISFLQKQQRNIEDEEEKGETTIIPTDRTLCCLFILI